MEDLYKYIPYFDNEFITNKDINPISPIVQLCYVLPVESHKFLSKDVRLLLSEKREWYTNDFNFKWAFCKYFWEAHVELPHIDINQLEKHIG